MPVLGFELDYYTWAMLCCNGGLHEVAQAALVRPGSVSFDAQKRSYSRLSHIRNQFPKKLPLFDLIIKKLSSRAFI